MRIELKNKKITWAVLFFLFPLLYRLYTIDSLRVTTWFTISLAIFLTYKFSKAKIKGNVIYPVLFSMTGILILPVSDISRMLNTVTQNNNILHILMVLFYVFFVYILFILSWGILYFFYKFGHSSGLNVPTEAHFICISDIIGYSVFPLLGFTLEFIKYFPAKLTTDSLDQIAQIKGEVPYSDIHSIGHTLFCSFLMKIWDSPAAVIAFQIISMSLAAGFALAYFRSRGVSNTVLLTISMLFACFGPNRDIITFFWKDNFYTVAILLSSVLLMMYIDRRESTSFSLLFLGGISASSVFLFRHNGSVVYISLVIIYLYFMFRYSKTKFLIPILSSLAIIVSVYYYAFEILHTMPNNHGAKYAIFAKAVVSVVSGNGDISSSQLNQLIHIVPKDIMLKYYKWNEGGGLLWIFGTPEYPGYIYNQAIFKYHGEVLNLFLHLFPRNIGIMTWDILGSSSLLWQFNLNYLDKNITYMYFILLCVFMLLIRKRYRELIPFCPVLFNILSIAISNTTYEPRYTYAVVAIFPFILLYTYYFASADNI